MGLTEDAASLHTQMESKQREATNAVAAVTTYEQSDGVERANAERQKATQLSQEASALGSQAEQIGAKIKQLESELARLDRDRRDRQTRLNEVEQQQRTLQSEIESLDTQINNKRYELGGAGGSLF